MIVHEDEIYNDSDEQIQTWGPEIGMFIFRIIQWLGVLKFDTHLNDGLLWIINQLRVV